MKGNLSKEYEKEDGEIDSVDLELTEVIVDEDKMLVK